MQDKEPNQYRIYVITDVEEINMLSKSMTTSR